MTEVDGEQSSSEIEEERGASLDPVLQVPILRLMSTQRIVGLPRIMADKLYVVSQDGKKNSLNLENFRFNTGDTSMQDEEGWADVMDEVLLCPWEVGFL